jgi:hypothetical protein
MNTQKLKNSSNQKVVAHLLEDRFNHVLEALTCIYCVGLFLACVIMIATSRV